MKFYICKKMRLLDWLTKHNHYPLREQVDIYDPSRVVWVYESTPELMQCVSDYYNRDEFLNRNN